MGGHAERLVSVGARSRGAPDQRALPVRELQRTSLPQRTTIFVRSSGNDANSGLAPARALRTISEAARVAPSGYRIVVGPGYYAEGITTDDCSVFSNQFGDILDAEDLIHAEYILEVSSPGLERELYSLRDFERFSGSLAKVKTKQAINGQKNFRGRILKTEGEEIFFEDRTSGNVNFPHNAVVKANLEFDLEAELKSRK